MVDSEPELDPTVRFITAAQYLLLQVLWMPWPVVMEAMRSLRYAVGSEEWYDDEIQ